MRSDPFKPNSRNCQLKPASGPYPNWKMLSETGRQRTSFDLYAGNAHDFCPSDHITFNQGRDLIRCTTLQYGTLRGKALTLSDWG